MQGVASLGYEVQELPMVPNGGIERYQQAAEVLKEFGRNGDTYIVHAAEGETMVPMEVLDANPRLKQMLWKQLEEMGVEPERYVVGNELNSLNPVTGQPEFFFKKIFKAVKKVVKKVVDVVKKVAPIILPIAAPFLLPAMPIAFATGIGSLAGGLISGQKFGDALKGAVITGGLAGLGNVAFGGSSGFGSGSFFGSKANPMAGLGEFSFQQAITPMNPLSSSYSANLAQLKSTGASAQQAAADPNLFNVNKRQVATVDGKEVGKEVVVGDGKPPTPEKTMFGDLKKSVTPGDEYGLGDFYGDYISPDRASIQPTADQISARATEIAQADIASAQNINKSLEAAGLQPAAIDTAKITTSAIETAKNQLAPSTFTKFAPMAAVGTGGALAADAATKGAVLGVFGPKEEGPSIQDYASGEDYYAQNPEKYGYGAGFYGDNPYYADAGYLPPAVRGNFDASGAGVNTASISQMVNQNLVNSMGPMQSVSSSPFDLALGQYNKNYLYPLTAAQGGEIVGPGTPTSDSIPALLSDGEFVMNARAVRGAGGGDRAQGAKRMYAMMRNFERRA